MAVAVGQRCVVRIKITDVELRKARDIKATIVSPQGEEKCQNVSFDEVSGVVYASVDVNSVGSWSMWLGVRFAEELFYTPSFVFAEVEGDAKPCDAPYIVDVEVSGESVTVTPPKVDVDAVTREEFERLSKDVAGKVDKVEGKGLSTNDYTDADKAEVAKISDKADKSELSNKQDTLTLTTKPNGNIVIGNLAGQTKEFMPATPSGDPMHYMYEAVGAVWNANTGYWNFYDMTDITNEEMRCSVVRGYISSEENSPLISSSRGTASMIRFNLPRLGGSNVNWNMATFARYNSKLEVLNLTNFKGVKTAFKDMLNYAGDLTNAFNGCAKLRKVYGIVYCSNVSSTTDAFKGCVSLDEIWIGKLKTSISFADSPLSVESATYLLQNADSTAQFTITFRADRQAIYEANADFITAKSDKPNITILYQ